MNNNIITLPDTDEISDLLLCIKSFCEYEGEKIEDRGIKGELVMGMAKYANREYYTPYHLYEVTDESIEIGDWCIDTYSNLPVECTEDNFGTNSFDYFKKIETTTNPDIGVKPMQEYKVKNYIYYNNIKVPIDQSLYKEKVYKKTDLIGKVQEFTYDIYTDFGFNIPDKWVEKWLEKNINNG